MDGICGTFVCDGGREAAERHLDRVVSWTGARELDRHCDDRIALCVTGHPEGRTSSSLWVGEDGDVRVALVGEIRNAAEPRALLEERGHRFRDRGSAGELLHHVLRSGDHSLLAALDGVWCCAAWDARSSRLTLVSDRTGMRTFHWFARRASIVFATSLKAVLAHPSVPRELDAGVLRETFEIGVITPPDTMIREVKVLRGGDCLEADGGREPVIRRRPRRFASPQPIDDVDDEERADRYFRALESAVLDSLSEKRAPGILLSGGIDSGALASIARRNGVRLRSYTIDLSENAAEASGARRLAGLFGTEHREITRLPDDAMESLPEAVWLQESIGGSSVNAVTELAFARSLDSDLDVVLTGDGNDLGWGIWDSRPLAAEDTDASFASVYAKLRRLVPADVVEKLLRPDSSSEDRLGRKLAAARLRTGSLDNDLIALDCEVYGENGPHRMVGRFRLDPSPLPFRFPYLDSRLWRGIDALPIAEKLAIESGPPRTKVLMRRALAKHRVLPDDVLCRPKTWMASPSTRWLRSEAGKTVERILLRPDAALARHVDVAFVRQLLRRHRAGPRWWSPRARAEDHTVALMMLLALEIWLRLFLESPDLARPPRLGELF